MRKNRVARTMFSLLALALALAAAAGQGAPGAMAGKLTDTSYGFTRSAPSAPNANMLVNADFETGAISPWTTATNGGVGVINSNAAFVHGGSFSARITTSSAVNA